MIKCIVHISFDLSKQEDEVNSADNTMTVVSKMDFAVRKVSVRGKRIEESISTFQRFVDRKYLEKLDTGC